MLDLLSQELNEVAQVLLNNNITLNEAQDAVKAVRLLEKASIPQKDWQRLTKATDKLSDPEFKDEALRLLKLEQDLSMDYKQALAQFEKLGPEVKAQEENRAKLDKEIEGRNGKIRELNREISDLKKKAKEERARLEEETRKDDRVRKELEAGKIDVPTLILVAQGLAGLPDEEKMKRLKEFGSLARTLANLDSEIKGKTETLKELSAKEEQAKRVLTSIEDKIVEYQRDTLEIVKYINKLKPLEVFLDIPCNICGKPLTHNWTREEVVNAFKDWGHKSCINKEK
jgi:predicted  nucleic acid-binding Zn-ribbon protein